MNPHRVLEALVTQTEIPRLPEIDEKFQNSKVLKDRSSVGRCSDYDRQTPMNAISTFVAQSL
jgi:hypothetical protein